MKPSLQPGLRHTARFEIDARPHHRLHGREGPRLRHADAGARRRDRLPRTAAAAPGCRRGLGRHPRRDWTTPPPPCRAWRSRWKWNSPRSRAAPPPSTIDRQRQRRADLPRHHHRFIVDVAHHRAAAGRQGREGRIGMTGPGRHRARSPPTATSAWPGRTCSPSRCEDGVATEVEPNFCAADVHPGGGKVCVKAFGLIQKTYNPNRVLTPDEAHQPEEGARPGSGLRADLLGRGARR